MTMTAETFPPLRPDNDKTALQSAYGSITYAELHRRIECLAAGLLQGDDDLGEERVAIFLGVRVHYVTALLGVWRAGGIAVPLNVNSAAPEVEHVLKTARVTRLLMSDECPDFLDDLCVSLGIEQVTVDRLQLSNPAELPDLDAGRRAMILFTSGTTSKPKGVVSTHDNIRAQVTTLLEAWGWREQDSIPLFLPLHHIHGIINVLCCGLWAGATVDLHRKLDLGRLTERVTRGDYTLFMAVPTIYVKAIRYLEEMPEEEREQVCAGFGAMRLNVSGSAACPVKLFEQWLELTGQTLLERYGMTEIGMALSNPYAGKRRPGAVGIPLPGVEVALFDEAGELVTEEESPGEIRVKGRNVFLEYWDNPKATQESFRDGWFCTGDVAVVEQGYYRIMGRSSVDIIKSGGYKLSALEIEGTLLNHDTIAECAVVGIEDDTWGEAVTAFLVLKPDTSLSHEELKAWCDGRMSAYKIPKRIRLLEALPRNAMGKVTKPELKSLYRQD